MAKHDAAPVADQAGQTNRNQGGFMARLRRHTRSIVMTSLLSMGLPAITPNDARASSGKPPAKDLDVKEMTKAMSFEDRYAYAQMDSELNAQLEEAAYKKLREDLAPDTIRTGVQLVSPFGDSFDDVKMTSKASKNRRIKEYGFRPTVHAAIDVVPSNTFKRIGMAVNTPEDVIVTESGMINSQLGKIGAIQMVSLDGKREHTYMHVNPVRIANVMNEETGKKVAVGDTLKAGTPVTRIENGPYVPHLHWEMSVNGVKQFAVMNKLLAQDGFAGSVTIEASEASKKYGPSATKALLAGMTIPEIEADIAQDNADRHDIMTPRGMIRHISEVVEGSEYVDQSRYGVTKKDDAKELKKYNLKTPRNLTLDQAVEILKENYYDKVADVKEKNNIETADPLFDMYAYNLMMHAGPGIAIPAMKKSQGNSDVLFGLTKKHYSQPRFKKYKNFKSRVRVLEEMRAEVTQRIENPNMVVALQGNEAARQAKLENVVAVDLEKAKKQEFAHMIEKEKSMDAISEVKLKTVQEQARENWESFKPTLPVAANAQHAVVQEKKSMSRAEIMANFEEMRQKRIQKAIPHMDGDPPAMVTEVSTKKSGNLLQQFSENVGRLFAGKRTAKHDPHIAVVNNYTL